MILSGDIGGTKTNLAVYAAESGLAAPLAESTFPSRRYDSLEKLVEDFRGHTHESSE
jgi:glucokinase